MAHLTQSFLRERSLADLESKYAIKPRRHSKYNNLVLLKYNQINSPMNQKIVQECRGLILDQDQDWQAVCYTYNKFFNYGEGSADEIDWSSARVYEKLDGSLMTIYFYDGQWHVSSSGMPDAAGPVNAGNISFADLFWKTWNELGYSEPEDTNCCYSFELMTPYNRVVVRHKESKIVLHGGRRLSDFKELNPVVEAHNWGWECVKTHSLSSWDDIESASKELDPMESEGYVVCDAQYNRVKVKAPAYVAISKLHDGFTTRRLLEKIITNDHEEFLSYFPEYVEDYYKMKVRYERLVGEITGFYNAIKHIEDRKTFALLAKDQKFSGVLFGLKFGKCNSIEDYLSEMNIRQLENWLGIKSVEI